MLLLVWLLVTWLYDDGYDFGQEYGDDAGEFGVGFVQTVLHTLNEVSHLGPVRELAALEVLREGEETVVGGATHTTVMAAQRTEQKTQAVVLHKLQAVNQGFYKIKTKLSINRYH